MAAERCIQPWFTTLLSRCAEPAAMNHRFHIVLIPVLVSSVVLAAASQHSSPNGKWRMTIEFPDEARSAGLELELNGEKITGRLIASFVGGEIPIQGSVKDAVVTFSG